MWIVDDWQPYNSKMTPGGPPLYSAMTIEPPSAAQVLPVTILKVNVSQVTNLEMQRHGRQYPTAHIETKLKLRSSS